MELSILIVNWNTRQALIDCLESVFKTIGQCSFEVWVVDNGSEDDSEQAVRTLFPQVHLIVNERNIGFAAANNQALKEAKGRYVMLLNSDTVLVEGSVGTLLNFMENNPEAGICCGQLLNADGTKQNSIANIPTLATEILSKSLLRRIFPGRFPGKEHDIREPIEVESVIGACMMVRKKAIDEVGCMDERFFFFLEETDWCSRMRKKGWKILFHPKAMIYHMQGLSAKKVRVEAKIEYWRSRYIFFEKEYGRTYMGVLKSTLLFKLICDYFLNLLLVSITLFLNSKARQKLEIYSKLLLWHRNGQPSDSGLNKGSIKT